MFCFCALCVNQEQFWTVLVSDISERESVMFLIDFKILLMQKHNFQKIIIVKNCRRSVGVRSFEWTVRVSLCVFACLCLLWLSQPLRREKPLDFYCLGNKHTKLFSHHPSLFKKGKQVLWVEAMKLIDGERKKKKHQRRWFDFSLVNLTKFNTHFRPFFHLMCERTRIIFTCSFNASVHILSHPSEGPKWYP